MHHQHRPSITSDTRQLLCSRCAFGLLEFQMFDSALASGSGKCGPVAHDIVDLNSHSPQHVHARSGVRGLGGVGKSLAGLE
eukprot:10049953-Alexandrium_andersonii.AAC.1